jgi:hypothetical protein
MYVYMALRQQYRGTSGTKRAAETTRSGWSSGLATLMMGLQRRANGRHDSMVLIASMFFDCKSPSPGCQVKRLRASEQ